MSDRQDSIEVSNSQPGVYGNFLVPIEQTRVSEPRDHHRGGFAYTNTEQRSEQRPEQRTEHMAGPLPASPTRYRNPPSYPVGYSTSESRSPHPRPQMAGPVYQTTINNGYGHDNTGRHEAMHVNGHRSNGNVPAQSIGRTPMIPGSSGPMHNRFVGYGIPPYVAHSQNSIAQVSYPGVSPPMAPSTGTSHGTSNVPVPAVVPYSSYGPISPSRPDSSSVNSIAGCKFDNGAASSDSSKFRRVGFSARLKSKHIYKVVRADRLDDCERFCLETKDFTCKAFNFRAFFPDNCELSSVDTAKFKLENADHFEHNTQFDYYERSERKALLSNSMDCFEVLQTCSPEGMELKLKTSEGFYGRIYTYGFYDSCFFDGNGASESVLRISKPNGFPRCGTQQVGDAMTNIVVVQFNDYVQTSRDKKYNLTCYISGPGEAVVTSNYLDTKTDGQVTIGQVE